MAPRHHTLKPQKILPPRRTAEYLPRDNRGMLLWIFLLQTLDLLCSKLLLLHHPCHTHFYKKGYCNLSIIKRYLSLA